MQVDGCEGGFGAGGLQCQLRLPDPYISIANHTDCQTEFAPLHLLFHTFVLPYAIAQPIATEFTKNMTKFRSKQTPFSALNLWEISKTGDNILPELLAFRLYDVSSFVFVYL